MLDFAKKMLEKLLISAFSSLLIWNIYIEKLRLLW